MKLEGKVAVVTGGGHGIGRALCRRFAAEGARGVVVADLDSGAAAAVAAEVGGVAIETDVRRESDLQQVVARVTEIYGAIDLFCSNAGIFTPGGVEVADDDWERIWEINVRAHVYAARAVLPAMLARGRGTVIFTGATASRRGAAKFAAFASAKFALRGLAQSLAREYGPQGIHVAHVLLDGLIDEPQTGQRFGVGASGRMAPDAIAAGYVDLVRQHPSAWTHELDLRPFSERF